MYVLEPIAMTRAFYLLFFHVATPLHFIAQSQNCVVEELGRHNNLKALSKK